MWLVGVVTQNFHRHTHLAIYFHTSAPPPIKISFLHLCNVNIKVLQDCSLTILYHINVSVHLMLTSKCCQIAVQKPDDCIGREIGGGGAEEAIAQQKILGIGGGGKGVLSPLLKIWLDHT